MRCSGLTVLLLAALAPAPAGAQAEGEQADEERADEERADADGAAAEYEQLIEQALTESGAGRFEEARVLFRRAHTVLPNARALRGIGMVAFEVRDYPDSIRNLRLALVDERRPLSDQQREEARRLLERAYGYVGRYRLAAVPRGARMLVDGHEAEVEPDGTLLLTVGRHEVHVRTAARSWEGRWTVRGGEHEPLPVVFEAPVTLAGPAPERAPMPAGPPAPADTTVPAILAVAGAVIAAVGVALLTAGLVDLDTVEGAMDGTPWPSLAGAHERAAPLTGSGIASIAIGGASALIGGVWLGVSDSGGAPLTAVGARLGARW